MDHQVLVDDEKAQLLKEMWNSRNIVVISEDGLTFGRLKMLGSFLLKFNACRESFLCNYTSGLGEINDISGKLLCHSSLANIALINNIGKHCPKMCRSNKMRWERTLANAAKVLAGIIFRQAVMNTTNDGQEQQKQHFATLLGIRTLHAFDSKWDKNMEMELTQSIGTCWQTLYAEKKLKYVEERINYTFNNKIYLIACLTHSCFHNFPEMDYQRKLAFFGDAILDHLVSRHLFFKFILLSGEMLQLIRMDLVNNRMLAQLAEHLDLHKHILHANEENNWNSYSNSDNDDDGTDYGIDENCAEKVVPKFHADIMEALAAAIYLDSSGNLESVWHVFEPIFEKVMPFQSCLSSVGIWRGI